MPDDSLQSFDPFEENRLKNLSTNVFPDVRQFIFQVALVRDQLVFQLLLAQPTNQKSFDDKSGE
jgi:hypothetical protein